MELRHVAIADTQSLLGYSEWITSHYSSASGCILCIQIAVFRCSFFVSMTEDIIISKFNNDKQLVSLNILPGVCV